MGNKKSFNLEKIGIYLAVLGFIYMFWQSQMSIVEKLSDIKERTKALEVKVEKLEVKVG